MKATAVFLINDTDTFFRLPVEDHESYEDVVEDNLMKLGEALDSRFMFFEDKQ